jgi:NTE family protein
MTTNNKGITDNEIIINIAKIINNIIPQDKAPNISIPMYIPNSQLAKKKILVLSGGGIKGISFLGALHALHEMSILQNMQTFAGTSVGALILLLLIVGFTPNDIYCVIKTIDLSKFKKISVQLFLNQFGLNSGDKIMLTLEKLLKSKNISSEITFSELFEKTKKTFIVSSVNITERKVEYFSHTTHPNMKVTQAIRMSISIPFVFTPVMYNKCMYVDGGCIDNFPIFQFTDRLEELIGICINDSDNSIRKPIETIYDYAISVIYSVFNGMSLPIIKMYEKYIINIEIKSINSIDFIPNETKEKLFNIGYQTVHKYFDK